MAKLKTIEARVLNILEHEPITRDDDKHLLRAYLSKFHHISDFIQYSYATNVPSFESIRRCRQKIQARGEFTARGDIKRLRDASRKEFKNYALNP